MKTVTKVKVFFDRANEEKWLDRCGGQGLLLVGHKKFRYIFEKTDSKWSYTVEWLDSSPLTEENAEYIKQKELSGRYRYCGGTSCFAIFASESHAAHSERGVARTQRRYNAISVFWAAIALFFIGLLVYNIVWTGEFDTMEYVIEETHDIPEFLKSLLVGKNPARLFCYALWPLTCAATLTAVYCGAVALHYRSAGKSFVKTGEFDK